MRGNGRGKESRKGEGGRGPGRKMRHFKLGKLETQ